MVEDPRDNLLAEQLKDGGDGNLYKPESSLSCAKDTIIRNNFMKKTNKKFSLSSSLLLTSPLLLYIHGDLPLSTMNTSITYLRPTTIRMRCGW